MENSDQQSDFTVSDSVAAMRGELAGTTAAAHEIVTLLLARHPEYGEGLAGDVVPWAQGERLRLPLEDWLVEISHLFEPRHLDGRLVIIGLVLLVHDLLPWLEQNYFFPSLWHENEPPVHAILSPVGREALEALMPSAGRQRAEATGSEPVETAVETSPEDGGHEAVAGNGDTVAANGGGSQPEAAASPRQARRLEAAMPETVRVGQTTELLVMLPRQEGEGLRAELPIETVGGEIIDRGDVTDREAVLTFPAPDVPLVVYLLVQTSKHDLEVEDPFRAILVYPDRDGDYETFFLTPLRVLDRAPVTVRLYEDEQRTKPLSSVRLATTIGVGEVETDPQLDRLRAAVAYAAASGPVTINYSFVGGDQISANISNSSGVALGREASAAVSGPTDVERIQVARLFTPLLALVASEAPRQLQVAVIGDVQALQEEVERGDIADDGRIADLIGTIESKVPAARPSLLAIFAEPLVATVVGATTRTVLDSRDPT